MNGYRISRTDSVAITQSRLRRGTEAVNRAFEHLDRMPESVYNVRQHRTLSVHERNFRELDKEMRRGAKLEEVLAGGMGVLMDLKDRYAAPTNIGVDGAHEAEFAVESQANPIQLKARVTRTVEDLRSAVEMTDKELATLMDLRREYVALLAQKELLEAHAS